MFTRSENNAEVEISVVEKNVSGVTEEAEAVYLSVDGAEEEIWSASKAEFTSATGGSSDAIVTGTVCSDSVGTYYEINVDNTATPGGLELSVYLKAEDLSGFGRTFEPYYTSLYATIEFISIGDDSMQDYYCEARPLGIIYAQHVDKHLGNTSDSTITREIAISKLASVSDSSVTGLISGIQLRFHTGGQSMDDYVYTQTYRIRNVYLKDNNTGETYPLGFNKSAEF